MIDEGIEELRLSTVPPDVTCVEEPTTTSFNQQRVRIECRVVGEEGRHGERPQVQRLAMMQVSGERRAVRCRREERCGLENTCCFFAEVDRHVGVELAREAVVVEMRMAQHDASQRIVGLGEAIDIRQRHLVVPSGRQRAPEVHHDSRAVSFEFDTAPADLVGAAVDRREHHTLSARLRTPSAVARRCRRFWL